MSSSSTALLSAHLLGAQHIKRVATLFRDLYETAEASDDGEGEEEDDSDEEHNNVTAAQVDLLTQRRKGL